MKDLIPYALVLAAFIGAAVIFRDQAMELFHLAMENVGL